MHPFTNMFLILLRINLIAKNVKNHTGRKLWLATYSEVWNIQLFVLMNHVFFYLVKLIAVY